MKGAQGTSAASSDAVRTIHSILCGERALDMRYSRKTHCTAADAERTAQSGAEAADAGTFHHVAFTCEILRKHLGNAGGARGTGCAVPGGSGHATCHVYPPVDRRERDLACSLQLLPKTAHRRALAGRAAPRAGTISRCMRRATSVAREQHATHFTKT